VDHACHNCDAAAALYDLLAFDEALDECAAFQRRVPDTLLVVTTDHGNSNLGLNGMGDSYGKSPELLRNLLKVKRSFPGMLDLLRKGRKYRGEAVGRQAQAAKLLNPDAHPDIDMDGLHRQLTEPDSSEQEIQFVRPIHELIDIVYESTGYKMSEHRARLLAPFLAKKGSTLYDIMNSEMAALGQLMGNYLGIGFTGTAHTADYVLLTALGPGADQMAGFVKNTDVFYRYLKFGKIDFRNPVESASLADAGPDAGSVERPEQYMLA
jgi:alkaline phosphatase